MQSPRSWGELQAACSIPPIGSAINQISEVNGSQFSCSHDC
jgi:hypothetical protein